MRFRALDHSSKLIKLKAEGLLSQALEHEVDHLNGILFLDHLESHEKLVKLDSEKQPDGVGVEGPPLQSSGVRATDVTTPQALAGPARDSEDIPASLKVN